jgi:hypothetical protein
MPNRSTEGYGRPTQRNCGDDVAEVQVHLFFLPSLFERFGLCDYKPIAAEEGA